MKILIPLTYLSVYGKNCNPFVRSLIDGLQSYDNTVICCLDDLWFRYADYDLIFFQWPDALYQYVEEFGINELARHLDEIKKRGIKLVVTCHNLHPHNLDSITTSIYELLYSKVDGMHHMGKYSYDVMRKKFPYAHHFIAPHHIANELFNNKISLEFARKELNIPLQNTVISSFGEFRNESEEKMFFNMSHDVSSKSITFLAPRLSITLYNGRFINKTIKSLYKYVCCKLNNVRYVGDFLSDEEQKIWLAASDIIFIQRNEILNSGNLPLAFSSGKIVVGPDMGNVGYLLRETKNFSFNPNDRLSVKNAVKNAIYEHKNGNRGDQNYKYAQEHWTVDSVCGIINRELNVILES